MKHSVRCCLVQLYGDLQPANAEPLSIETLAGALASVSPYVNTTLTTFGVHHSSSERQHILRQLTEENYDIIGISVPQGTFDDASTILNTIYQQITPPVVVVGHALPTTLPDLFLGLFPKVLIVRGWGENAIVELCRQVWQGEPDLGAVPSLTYKDSAGIRHDNPLQTLLVGTPVRLDSSDYFCRVESSRGCHYDVCTFCSRLPRLRNSAAWKRLDIDNVIKQVQELADANVKTFTFSDEDFIGNDLEGALQLAEALGKIPGLSFTISVRVDSVIERSNSTVVSADHSALFWKLRQAGLSMVFMGAESFASSQLRRYGKGVTPQDNIAAVKALESYDVGIELGLIMFDPMVTLEELRENVNTLLQTSYYQYAGYPFSFLRAQVNTPYAALLKKHDLLGDLIPNLAAFETRYASPFVAIIADRCKNFNFMLNNFYAALRNVQRSNPAVTHPYKQELDEIRGIQVEYLAALLSHSEQEIQEGLPDVAPWYERVERCWKLVASTMPIPGLHTPELERLTEPVND